MGYWVFLDQKNAIALKQGLGDRKRVAHSQGLEKIIINRNEGSFSLELREGQWWITQPILYPAYPDFMVRSLRVMNQVVADAIFAFNEDRFDFAKSQSQMKLSYADGVEKLLILSPKPMVDSKIYVLNKTENKVYVVHNVWGQLFYYGYDQLIDKGFPWSSWDIENVEFFKGKEILWKANKRDSSWRIEIDGKSYSLESHKLLWWLRSIKEVKVSPQEFDVEWSGANDFMLKVKASGKSEHIFFDAGKNKVYISSLKAIAEMDPSSLQLIDQELKKVIKDAK